MTPTPLPVERRPTSSVECAIHHVVEHAYEDTYRECGECWHVFQTKADLQAAQDAMADGYDLPRRDESTIYSCPLCGHDW